MKKTCFAISILVALFVGFLSAFPAIADTGDYKYYMTVEITNNNTSSKTARIAIPMNAAGLIDGKYIQDDAEDISLGTTDLMATDLSSAAANWYTDIITLNPQSVTNRTFYLGDPDATRDQTFISQDGDTFSIPDDDSLDITNNLTVTADTYLDTLPTSEKHIVDKDGAYGLTVDSTNYNFTVFTSGSTSPYSSAADGYMQKVGSPYTTVQANASADDVVAGGNNAVIGQGFDGVSNYYILRAAFYFDTSAIPDSATITAASLHLYGYEDDSFTDFDIVVTNGQPTYPHDPLVVGDYSKTNFTGTGGTLSTVGFSVGGYNTVTLDATGRSWINKTGTTKLYLVSAEDIAISAPTMWECVKVYTADEAGTGKDPYLSVTFASSSTTVSAPATTDAWKTAKGTYDGSHIKLYVDGIEKDSESLIGTIPTNANCVNLMEAQGKYDTIKIGSTSIVTPTWVASYEFEPDEIAPNALTSYSTSSDGDIYATNANYNTTQSAATGTVEAVSAIGVGQVYVPGGYWIYRGALFFDTSSIPDTAMVISATLKVWGLIDNSNTDFDLTVTNGQPTYPSDPLVSGDYDRTHYSGDGGTLNTSEYNINEYNNITLNSTGMGWVNRTGITKLFLRSSRDISATSPIGNESITVASSETTGTDQDPMLIVTYGNITDLSASNNDAIIMTLGGNPGGVVVNVLDLTPIQESEASATTQEQISPFVVETPAAPAGGLYGEGDYSKLPGAVIINDALEDAGIPPSFFWIPIIVLICIVVGLWLYGRQGEGSRSLMASAIGITVVLAFFSGIEFIPWWTLIPWGFIATGILIMQRSYGF